MLNLCRCFLHSLFVTHNEIYLLKVIEVDMPRNQIIVAFQINLTWRDPRLQFNHLKASDSSMGNSLGTSNLVPKENNSAGSRESYAIWTPTIMFFNTRNMLSTTRIDSDESSIVNVLRNGTGRSNSMENLDMVEIFTGSENPLVKVGLHCRLQVSAIAEFSSR